MKQQKTFPENCNYQLRRAKPEALKTTIEITIAMETVKFFVTTGKISLGKSKPIHKNMTMVKEEYWIKQKLEKKNENQFMGYFHFPFKLSLANNYDMPL